MTDSDNPVFSSASEERDFWQHLLQCGWCRIKLDSTELGVFYTNLFEDEVFWEEVRSYLGGTHPTPEHFVEAMTYGLRGLDAADLLDWFEEAPLEELEEVLDSGPLDVELRRIVTKTARPAKRIVYHCVICQACVPGFIQAIEFLRNSYSNEEIMNFKFWQKRT